MKTNIKTNRSRYTTTKVNGATNSNHRNVTSKAASINAPDLTKRPPRSPRSRLGGYALLPRMLDKGRATAAGMNGEYHFNCPLDQHILNFAGIDPEALLTELK